MFLDLWIPALVSERWRPQGFGWVTLRKGKDDGEDVDGQRSANYRVDDCTAPLGLLVNDTQSENTNGRLGSTKQQDGRWLHNPRPLECFKDLLLRKVRDMSGSTNACHV